LLDGQPDNLVGMVLAVLRGAYRSREVLEAEMPPELRPAGEDRLMLDNWACAVEREGTLLAHLSVVPTTRVELMEAMLGLVYRAPAWLQARARGEPMTLTLFARGLAQAQAVQRREFERVIAEQVLDPEPIERCLAQAPVPDSEAEQPRSELVAAVGEVSRAHLEALVEIALDLEARFGPVVFVDPP
jgi:hypothetical protein